MWHGQKTGAVVLDRRPLRALPEGVERAGYDGAKRKQGSKLRRARWIPPGHLLALHVTAADADDRAEIGRLAKAVPAATGENIEAARVDQGYTGAKLVAAAREQGIEREVVKHPRSGSPAWGNGGGETALRCRPIRTPARSRPLRSRGPPGTGCRRVLRGRGGGAGTKASRLPARDPTRHSTRPATA